MANFSTKILGLAGSALVFAGMAFGQTTCPSTAASSTNANIIRAEGTAEQVGTLNISCPGSTAVAASGINLQVFISPALPVTSRVIVSGTSQTEATLTVTGSSGSTTILGTVSGSTINFSGNAPATSGGLTFAITNVRVNATSLSVGTGVPPSVSETVFLSGPAVTPTALSAVPVAFAENGLGGTKTFRTFTGTLTNGAGTNAGVNSFVICNAYSPKVDKYAPGAGVIAGFSSATGAAKSLAAVVEVNENFAQAFKTAAHEVDTIAYATGDAPGGVTTTSSTGVISTRIRVSFANVPSNVTILLPVGLLTSQTGSAGLTWVTSETGTTAQTSDSLDSENGLALRAVALTTGAGSAVFSVTADDLTTLDKFDIPVFVSTSANAVAGSNTPMTVSVSLGPIGSTSVPNFAVGSSTTTTTLSTFSLCTTSLLFPFVTNQLGFDTGLAISNTSTDPFQSNGATAQAGTCTLNFYGAGAPSPANVTTPNIPSGTVYTQVLSGVGAGFQGYIIAQCSFQYAHGFAFVTDGVGVNGGLSQGYLAGVIPDVNQKARGADPAGQAGLGTGETLGN